MITINKASVNTVVLTLTEKVTLSAPYYFLFSFTSQTTFDTVNFIAADTSLFTDRYNEFSITETTNPNLLNSQCELNPKGFWNYKIYAQSSSTNLVPEDANELIEEGIVKVEWDDLDVNYYDTDATDTNEVYNP